MVEHRSDDRLGRGCGGLHLADLSCVRTREDLARLTEGAESTGRRGGMEAAPEARLLLAQKQAVAGCEAEVEELE